MTLFKGGQRIYIKVSKIEDIYHSEKDCFGEEQGSDNSYEIGQGLVRPYYVIVTVS